MADPEKGAHRSLPAEEQTQLIRDALAARSRAYAPYSGYAVGAAIQSAHGAVHTGCNVENASFGLCMCAERVAIGSAVAAGELDFVAMAVATQSSPPASPCGACRQVLNELAPQAVLLLCNPTGEVRQTTVADLLPWAFEKTALGVPRPTEAQP
jgi:cytidine deaminase